MDLIPDEHPQSEEEVQLKRVFSIPLAIPPSILLHADEELDEAARLATAQNLRRFAKLICRAPDAPGGRTAQRHSQNSGPSLTLSPQVQWRRSVPLKNRLLRQSLCGRNPRGKADTRIKCNHPMPASETTDSRVGERGCKFAAKTGEHAFRHRMSSVWTACPGAWRQYFGR
jgi:hypothetical protein